MIIISDLHVGDVDVSILEHLIEEAKKDEDQLVIICGDLSLTSTAEQFAVVEDFFQKLMKAGILVVATVGNHDFGGTFAEQSSRIMSTKGYDDSVNALLRIFMPLFQQQCVIAYQADQLDYVVRYGNHIFCSLRSHHRKIARIKNVQILWLQNVLDNIKDRQDCTLHFVTHYSLWQDPGDKHVPLDRRNRLENEILKKYAFSTYLHGHNHRYTYQNTTTPKLNYRYDYYFY